MELTPAQAEAFWAKVDRTGECWLWLPRWPRWRAGDGKTLSAREAAWLLTGAPGLKDGEFLCVTCRKGACVRHLRLSAHTRGDRHRQPRDKGVMSQQARDKLSRGTHVRGEDHGRGKLTRLQAREILGSKESDRALAKRFGVSQNAVWKIRNRRSWKELR